MSSAALAVSTKASMILNVCLTFGLFIVGHQLGALVHLLIGEGGSVGFLAALILRIIPNFEFLNYASDIAFGKIVPMSLVGQLVLYTLGWVAAFLLLANALFEQRELT